MRTTEQNEYIREFAQFLYSMNYLARRSVDEVIMEFENWKKTKVSDTVCPFCVMGRDEFDPDWKCPDCRGITDL